MTAAEAVIKALDSGYGYIGIRAIDTDNDTFDYEVGKYVPDSYDWDHDLDCSTRETTGETLNGASAIAIKANSMMEPEEIEALVSDALNKLGGYIGNLKVIIAGNDIGYGEDEDEYIIKDATMIYKF